jgi:hypothetical protein
MDVQEIFRRHSEAQFEVLPEVAKATLAGYLDSYNSDEEDKEDKE